LDFSVHGEPVERNIPEVANLDHNMFDDSASTSGITPARATINVPAGRFNKYPAIIEEFTDPETHYKMVIVQINMPSGSKGFEVSLNESGTTVTVSYKWGKTMHDKNLMFDKELNQQLLEQYHPKLVAHENGLKKVRNNADDVPDGAIEIDLPTKVQTDPNSWSFKGKERKGRDTTVVIEIEFKCLAEAYHRKSSVVVFEN
jgi:hypothetical protein